MTEETKRIEPAPVPTPFDYAIIAAKVRSIPASFVAPLTMPAVGFFDLIITPIRAKRINDWCEELRLQLNELSIKQRQADASLREPVTDIPEFRTRGMQCLETLSRIDAGNGTRHR